MSIVQAIIKDLRERRLWPVAIALVAALVAVPVLLMHSAKSVAVPPAAAAGLPTSLASGGPVVNAGSAPAKSPLPGQGRDPFTQQKLASTAAAGTSASSAAGTGAAAGSTGSTGPSATSGTAGLSVPSGSSTSGGVSGTGTTPTATPTTTTPTTTTTTTTPTATPTPAGLTSKQSYTVAVAINNPSGGFDTVDPLARLSLIPSKDTPLLIELGVLKGGHRVLFVVQPGTVVGGPGTCTPGPIDCAILSLGENQTETLSRQSPSGVVPVTSFAVTAIGVADHSSVAEANKARAAASAAGRKVLDKSTLSALSLFQYDPSSGAVLDLRNLTVGGS